MTRLISLAGLFAVALSAASACSGSHLTGPANDPTLSSSSGTGGRTGTNGTGTVPSGSNSGRTQAGRVRVFATLLPPASGAFPRANGKAKWDSRGPAAQRELEMEVEDLVPGTEVTFFLDGAQIGSTVLADAFGEAKLELSTQLGHAVPTAVAGLTAEARTPGGTVIVTGVFP